MDPLTFLCLASYEKGHDFMREAKRQGARVFLITSLSLKDKAQWPRESIDDVFYMPDQDKTWNRNDTLLAISHLARTQAIDRVVALDDFDLEMAASLREHLRIPGMGETTTRYFRDKLAMRMRAIEAGLKVPEFVHLLNDAKVRDFTERIPPPWVLKPRLMAGAIGIQVVHSLDELRAADHALGDQRSFFLVERFVSGDVCHVDSIVYENQISVRRRQPVRTSTARCVAPRRHLYHATSGTRVAGCGSVVSGQPERVSPPWDYCAGFRTPSSLRATTAELYFLETSARVGGAHIAELVEAATGLNLWGEWAKVEIAGGKRSLTRRQRPPTITPRCWCRSPGRSIPTPRLITIRKSYGACSCRTMWE